MPPEPSEPLRVEIAARDRAAVVALIGSADMDEIEPLRQALGQALETAPETLVLDLSRLTFICSEGLGALLQARILCRAKQVRICLVAPAAPVRKIFQTTRLDKVMPIVDTVEQALASS